MSVHLVIVNSGNTFAAASCSSAAVQAAIDLASTGDTVTIPAGSCTWTSAVTVNNKAIRIIGAGIDNTIITSNTSGNTPLQITVRSSDVAIAPLYVSGITWNMITGVGGGGYIYVYINSPAGYPPAAKFRITQMKMNGDPSDGVSSGGRYISTSGIYGVIDHVEMTCTTNRGASNISMIRDNNNTQSNTYHTPQSLGDNNALYIEDCIFNYPGNYQGNGAIDMYVGARYVFRHNTVYNNNIGNHGLDSQNRGTRSFEIYENTFIADSSSNAIEPFGPRSATGVVWNNTVKNIQPQSGGYINFFTPRYYGANSAWQMGSGIYFNANLAARATVYYPSNPWGTLPFPGMAATVDDGINNYVSGNNPLDGNQIGPGHLDPDNTRTVTDLVTTIGSNIINSATANFNYSTDYYKDIFATNISPRRWIRDGIWSSGSSTITSATANFTVGDVGREIGDINVKIPHGSWIVSVTNSTTAVINNVTGSASSGDSVFLNGPYITAVNSSTQAVLSVPATASGTGGTLSIGYTDQGYPLLDQPCRGSFATANAGNWPNVTTGYTDANYETLDPTYLWGNHWQTVDGSLNVLTDTIPPATAPGLYGSEAYIKHGRDYYDDRDNIPKPDYTPYTYPFPVI